MLHEIPLSQLSTADWALFGKNNALLTAGTADHCNTMTIGWLQMGVTWRVPVCTVYARPERYTYEFLEENDYFSVSVLPVEHKKAMGICGVKSGRDMDKITQSGLSVAVGAQGAPYIAQAEWVVVCRKLYAHDMDTASILDHDRLDVCYGPGPGRGNFHRIYTGEIVAVYHS